MRRIVRRHVVTHTSACHAITRSRPRSSTNGVVSQMSQRRRRESRAVIARSRRVSIDGLSIAIAIDRSLASIARHGLDRDVSVVAHGPTFEGVGSPGVQFGQSANHDQQPWWDTRGSVVVCTRSPYRAMGACVCVCVWVWDRVYAI